MQSLRVLLVEPDDAVARAVARTVAQDGIEVVRTHLPAEALEWVAAGQRFDAIVSAVMMRYLTGPEFLRRLGLVDRALTSRVIFLSGGVGPKQAAFLRTVPNRLLFKPCDRRLLVAAIREVAGVVPDEPETS